MRWVARRCESPRAVVWDADDLFQEFCLLALSIPRRYAGRSDEELTWILTRSCARRASSLVRRDAARSAVVLDVDVREFADPAWALPFIRDEALREIDRVLSGLEADVARAVLEPTPIVARAARDRLAASPLSRRYVTLEDVAAALGVGYQSVQRSFASGVTRLAVASEAHARP